MAAEFPTSVANFTNPNPATDDLDTPVGGLTHSGQHGKVNDEIEATQTKVGTGSSTPTSGKVLRGTGAGTSGWGQISNADVDAAADIVETKLKKGSNNTVLQTDASGVVKWATATSAMIADDWIVNADIKSDAAIALSKLASGATGEFIRGNASGVPVYAALPGGNAVINGDFVSQQRTVMPTADNAYAHDQWRLLLGAANAATVANESSDLPSGGARNAAKLIVGSANNNKFGYFTPIEGLVMWPLRGQTVSLQFKLKTTSGIGDIRAAVVQWTGTEDAVSADPINAWGSAGTNPTYTGSWANANTPASLSPTTSWATYKIEGVSISASATNLAVFVWCDDTSTTQTTDYFLLTDVQLELSAVATAYQRVNPSMTILQCHRYLWRITNSSAGYNLIGEGGAFSGTQSRFTFQAPVRMRATPTLSYSDVGDFNVSVGAQSVNAATVMTLQFTVQARFLAVTVTTANVLTGGQSVSIFFTNSADKYLQFSSEL